LIADNSAVIRFPLFEYLGISAVLQSRPLGDESEIRGSASSLNHDTYVSSEESEIRGYASPSKDLSQYFLRGKNMDPIENIDGNISTYTRPFRGASLRHDEITELSKNNTEISPKINEETNINEISKARRAIYSAIEIPNITPYLAQQGK